ncbi:MAG: hypothetical protein PHW64_02700 [Sulfuricurvum sp.]|nr:hypothetical protein [Sulfuricurvum sp.]
MNELVQKYYANLKNSLDFSAIKNTTLYQTNQSYVSAISYIEKNIESIIADKPIRLREHIKEILTFNIQLVKHKKPKNINLLPQQIHENEFINALIKIFDYDTKIDKVDFAKNLKLISCPYCNREYIFKFYDKTKSELRTVAHLDHFYSQKNYPFLALSFYNLIPSCSICNSKFKAQANFYNIPHLHPYEDDFNKKAKFTHSFNSPTHANKQYPLFSTKRISLALKPINDKDNETKNTIKTFRLNELYGEHKDIVLELIQKAEIYNDSYIEELMHNYEGRLFKNREDLMRLITCGYITDDEINKRPLSKLIKDISEELGLI